MATDAPTRRQSRHRERGRTPALARTAEETPSLREACWLPLAGETPKSIIGQRSLKAGMFQHAPLPEFLEKCLDFGNFHAL